MYLEKVERVGQIKVNDRLLYLSGSEGLCYGVVKEVINSGVTNDSTGEEIILKHNKGAYFLLANYLKGNSWVKDAYIIRTQVHQPAQVVINGVPYVPRASVPPLTDERLQRALEELVSIQYFNEAHKARAKAWNVLHALAPELAELCSQDPDAAYHRVHGDEVAPTPAMSPEQLRNFEDSLRDIEQPWRRTRNL